MQLEQCRRAVECNHRMQAHLKRHMLLVDVLLHADVYWSCTFFTMASSLSLCLRRNAGSPFSVKALDCRPGGNHRYARAVFQRCASDILCRFFEHCHWFVLLPACMCRVSRSPQRLVDARANGLLEKPLSLCFCRLPRVWRCPRTFLNSFDFRSSRRANGILAKRFSDGVRWLPHLWSRSRNCALDSTPSLAYALSHNALGGEWKPKRLARK